MAKEVRPGEDDKPYVYDKGDLIDLRDPAPEGAVDVATPTNIAPEFTEQTAADTQTTAVENTPQKNAEAAVPQKDFNKFRDVRRDQMARDLFKKMLGKENSAPGVVADTAESLSLKEPETNEDKAKQRREALGTLFKKMLGKGEPAPAAKMVEGSAAPMKDVREEERNTGPVDGQVAPELPATDDVKTIAEVVDEKKVEAKQGGPGTLGVDSQADVALPESAQEGKPKSNVAATQHVKPAAQSTSPLDSNLQADAMTKSKNEGSSQPGFSLVDILIAMLAKFIDGLKGIITEQQQAQSTSKKENNSQGSFDSKAGLQPLPSQSQANRQQQSTEMRDYMMFVRANKTTASGGVEPLNPKQEIEDPVAASVNNKASL